MMTSPARANDRQPLGHGLGRKQRIMMTADKNQSITHAMWVRADDPDLNTDWTDPGSTMGIPDRFQIRALGGLHLTAGHNHRRPPDFTEKRTPFRTASK